MRSSDVSNTLRGAGLNSITVARLSRRAFLASGVVLASPPWLKAQVDGAVRQRPKLSDNPFQLGVASGEPSPDGFVIWTRLAPQPLRGGGMPDQLVAVSWQVATDEAMTKIVRKGNTVATPQLAHSVHVEVEGLEEDRWYWYQFRVGNDVSPIGRARTTPAASAMPQRLRFSFVSCQHYETGYYTGFRHMAESAPDLIVHLGDYIYEEAASEGKVRQHLGGELLSLVEYRNRYAQYKSDPNLQAAHEVCPWLVTWDDHEFDNNYANLVSEEPNVAVVEFAQRRANAYQAYYEHMPLRRRLLPHGPDMRLYRHVPFGRLADFLVLDTRQYRTDQPNGDGLKALEGDVFRPDATILGQRQQRWLHSRLLSSKSTWNVMAQQVLMARIDRLPGEESGFPMDKWAGYDVERQRLMDFLGTRRIPNPIVLTGDIHTNWVCELKRDYDDENSPTVATEFVGTSITSGGDGRQKLAYTDGMLAENPSIRFHNAERGYVHCTVTPNEWQSDYLVLESVVVPESPLIKRKSFVVERGQAGVHEA